VTAEFKKAVNGLAKDKQKAVLQAVEKMGSEVLVPSLKIRSFQNSDGLYLANVGRTGYRIVFAQPGDDVAELLDICPHDVTYRKWNRRKG